MGNNGHIGQLIGPFKANDELYTKIKENAKIDILYVKHLGIQTEVSTIVYINNKPYEVGKTGIYEIGNTEIKSIYFSKDTDVYTIIDYIIEFDKK